MARQSGLIKIKGTLDNVSFYKTKDGDLARMKTSVDGDRIANDPAFVRTRENNSEFGSSARSGKLTRDNLRPISMNATDGRVVARMTKIMTQIKNLDTTSVRGARNVGVAMATAQAKALLKGFEFNNDAMLSSMLFKPWAVNTTTGVITIAGLVPTLDLIYPEGATHVSFTGGYANINYATGIADVKLTNVQNLPITGTSSAITLTPTAVPTGTGAKIFLLKIEFFQLVNAVQYSLKNGAYNALKIIEVI
ncbi:MAG: hypothetical protein K9G36_10605 [Crocinitomicaceae bacterium]|nr:hypothetical protein [Crocinitomicaceae bacterium]